MCRSTPGNPSRARRSEEGLLRECLLCYHVYRKAADEPRFTWIGTVQATSASTYTFSDTTVTKADYTYYVTAFKPFSGTPGEEPRWTVKTGH